MASTFEAIQKRYEDAFNRRDLNAVADLYTHDAIFYNPDATLSEGRSGIIAMLEQMHDMGKQLAQGKGFRFTSPQTEEAIHGDSAYRIGTFAFRAPDGTVLMNGTDTALLKKMGPEWKIHRHMVTLNVAAEVEAAQEPAFA